MDFDDVLAGSGNKAFVDVFDVDVAAGYGEYLVVVETHCHFVGVVVVGGDVAAVVVHGVDDVVAHYELEGTEAVKIQPLLHD